MSRKLACRTFFSIFSLLFGWAAYSGDWYVWVCVYLFLILGMVGDVLIFNEKKDQPNED